MFFSITSTQSKEINKYLQRRKERQMGKGTAVITDPSCPAFPQSGFGYKLKAAIKVKV